VSSTAVLVACVGNVFRSDDGFGSAVARALAARGLPDGVRVVDYGIRSLHLLYDLMDGVDALVLVDTVGSVDGPPGSLVVLEPSLPDAAPASGSPAFDPHDLPPGGTLALLTTYDVAVGRVLVVGCVPESLDDGLGLTATVEAAVEPAVELVLRTVAERLLTSS
jgi:hydrogenase maturation protease